MRKSLLLLLLLSLLTACTATPAPGGDGASAPALRRTIMQSDRLYVDAERQIHFIRCGTMDDAIDSTVDTSKLPTKNNQSNFGTGFEYQATSEHSMDVVIDDKWMRFEASDNPTGLVLLARDADATGASLVFVHTASATTLDLQTGSWFELEEEVEGVWRTMDTLSGELLNWDDIAYPLTQDADTALEVDWESSYGFLDAGTYRISKEVTNFRKTGDYDQYILQAEFTLEEYTYFANECSVQE